MQLCYKSNIPACISLLHKCHHIGWTCVYLLAQEELSSLKTQLAHLQAPAEVHPALPTPCAAASSGSFEVGFGSTEQHQIFSSFSLQLENFVHELISLKPKQQQQHVWRLPATIKNLHQHLMKVPGMPTQEGSLHGVSHATVHHYLLHLILGKCQDPLLLPDIHQVHTLSARLDGAEDFAAQRQLSARLYRSWFLSADNLPHV